MPMARVGSVMAMLLKHSYSHMADICFELCEKLNVFDKYLNTQFVRHSKHSHSHFNDQSVIAVQGHNSLCYIIVHKSEFTHSNVHSCAILGFNVLA
jgi:hypothetical protein